MTGQCQDLNQQEMGTELQCLLYDLTPIKALVEGAGGNKKEKQTVIMNKPFKQTDGLYCCKKCVSMVHEDTGMFISTDE
jgi:hypothetical protein